MPAPLRIAYARISHETNALSPVLTTVEAFERFHLVRGDALRRCIRPWRRETSQPMLYNAELSGLWAAAATDPGVQLVPLLSAWAIPSGKLRAETFDSLCDELIEGLASAGAIEGVFLVLHGAMGVQDHDDPEADLLERVRRAVGPAVRVAVVFDMHAILTPRKLAPVDLVFGYRTNPHRDHFSIGRHAGVQLIRVLRGRSHPTLTWRALPMVMGGSPTLDFMAPMRDVFRYMRQQQRRPGVVSCSIFQSQLWHDSPQGGWSVVVLAESSSLGDEVADALADRLWAVRDVLPPEVPSVEQAIAAARAAKVRRWLGVVCLSDTSDIVGAGSVGENTAIARELLAHATDLVSYVPLRDAEAVEALWARDGERVTLPVGGKLAPEWYAPLTVTGTVVRGVDTPLWGRSVVLDCGHVVFVLTEHAAMASGGAFYRDLSMSLFTADLVVVKTLFTFRLYFWPYNRLSLFARTRGITDFDVYERLEYDRPVHPRDPVQHWRPGDQMRRQPAPADSEQDGGRER